MPEHTTRRRFLRDTAIASAAVVLLEPGGAWAAPPSDVNSRSRNGRGRGRVRRGLSDGVFADVEFGDGRVEPIARWTRLGDDLTLELRPATIVIDVPTRSETVEMITIVDFELGRGHDEIAREFGPTALAQLRSQVAYLDVFAPSFDAAA